MLFGLMNGVPEIVAGREVHFVGILDDGARDLDDFFIVLPLAVLRILILTFAGIFIRIWFARRLWAVGTRPFATGRAHHGARGLFGWGFLLCGQGSEEGEMVSE